jgi:hypothetical protein
MYLYPSDGMVLSTGDVDGMVDDCPSFLGMLLLWILFHDLL